jgi:hypothetical protein
MDTKEKKRKQNTNSLGNHYELDEVGRIIGTGAQFIEIDNKKARPRKVRSEPCKIRCEALVIGIKLKD